MYVADISSKTGYLSLAHDFQGEGVGQGRFNRVDYVFALT